MNRFLLSTLLVLLLFPSSSLFAQMFSERPAWSEEFSSFPWRTKLSAWNIHKGKFASELEFYTDSIGNVFIRSGFLHLRATSDKREDKVCSSGRISTLGYKSFLYGKLEVRAKSPIGKGIFPAIWMLREDHPTVFPLGEIDIMEYIDCFEGKEYCTTTHIVEKEPGNNEIRHRYFSMIGADMNKFHIYGLEWTPTSLRFMLDREEVYRLEKENVEFWPFDAPYVLILNVAYGSWGAECGIDDTIFPREMLVDWIRYYPLNEN